VEGFVEPNKKESNTVVNVLLDPFMTEFKMLIPVLAWPPMNEPDALTVAALEIPTMTE
jgi:hypothetical protein